jgi:deazaflavin-dependent oxidoreductase (nitroreductase family)
VVGDGGTNPPSLFNDKETPMTEGIKTELGMTNERGYRRQTRMHVHLWDPLARFMIRRGLAPGGDSEDGSGMRVLEVRGRKTGRWYQRPVAVAAVDGQRYIVSLSGESQWARNLRAGSGAQLRVGSRIDPIAAHELGDAEEKATIIHAISRQYPYFARGYFKVDPKQVTLEQARELAPRYPVFRIQAPTAQ